MTTNAVDFVCVCFFSRFLQSFPRRGERGCVLACQCLSQRVGVCCAGVYATRRVNMFVWAPLHAYTYSTESDCPTRRPAEMRGARFSALQLLLLSCLVCAAAGYLFRTPLDLDVTPRITVLSSGKHRHKHMVSVSGLSNMFYSQTLNCFIAVLRWLITWILMQSFLSNQLSGKKLLMLSLYITMHPLTSVSFFI